MRAYKIVMVIASAVALTACGLSKPINLPALSRYTITSLQVAKSPRTSRSRSTLLVSVPVSNPGYQSAKMIYMNVPFRLRSYANNRWVAPPANMLLPLFAQRIRNKGYFKAVVTPPFSGVTNYRLDTQLIMLQQEFITPISQVRLVVQATLVSNRTNAVIASRRFQVAVSAPANNPYSGVLATNKAATIISGRIARFVLKSV